ncbi:MAG: hypothetical protein PHG63_02640 [Candidatus Dojkabacteria bacterium]|nr:hypothetical protein [Candidatus Dojkabacteria bacterium]
MSSLESNNVKKADPTLSIPPRQEGPEEKKSAEHAGRTVSFKGALMYLPFVLFACVGIGLMGYVLFASVFGNDEKADGMQGQDSALTQDQDQDTDGQNDVNHETDGILPDESEEEQGDVEDGTVHGGWAVYRSTELGFSVEHPEEYVPETIFDESGQNPLCIVFCTETVSGDHLSVGRPYFVLGFGPDAGACFRSPDEMTGGVESSDIRMTVAGETVEGEAVTFDLGGEMMVNSTVMLERQDTPSEYEFFAISWEYAEIDEDDVKLDLLGMAESIRWLE